MGAPIHQQLGYRVGSCLSVSFELRDSCGQHLVSSCAWLSHSSYISSFLLQGSHTESSFSSGYGSIAHHNDGTMSASCCGAFQNWMYLSSWLVSRRNRKEPMYSALI